MFEYLAAIVNVFSLWDRLKHRWFPSLVVTNTAQRFIRLFEAHGVSRAQIPRFFGHGLTINQVEVESELLKALDNKILQSAATLFGIRLEWLEGGSEELYELKHFYKQPKIFGEWLDSLKKDADNIKVEGWLLIAEFKTYQYDALILMREKVGELADENIYRYYFCEKWIYGYWKCRADIAACVAQGWKRNCYISGRNISKVCFNELASLKYIPNSESEKTVISNKRFHAEDLTTDPNMFTQGLYDGQFGKASALSRLLSYFEQNLMDSGFGNCWKKFDVFLKELK